MPGIPSIEGGELEGVTVTAPKPGTGQTSGSGGSIWQSLFANIGSIETGASQIITAIKGGQPVYTNVQPQTQQETRTGNGTLFLIVGGVVLVVLVALWWFKKK